MEEIANIPRAAYKRIVIVGGGFGGLKMAKQLKNSGFQLVLIDKNNYHQFQPLLYQVATSGLEPSAICFPLRKAFQNQKDVFIRMADVLEIEAENNAINTSIGAITYDYLVIATGATTNYFGNESIAKNVLSMKSVSEALALRNHILQNFENRTNNHSRNEKLLNIVIVGGGPTGVEVAGTIAEMRNHILKKDYPEIDFSQLKITVVDFANRLLTTFSEQSSAKAKLYLEQSGVLVKLNSKVKSIDGETVTFEDGSAIDSNTVIWAAGITGNLIKGLPVSVTAPGNRYRVNEYQMVEGYHNIFAIGDVAYGIEKHHPAGFPQVAQVAIQQGINLTGNFKRLIHGQPLKPFVYIDLGSMATIGRHKAVVEIGRFKIYGITAWYIWMFVHLMSLLGVKNRILIFINWAWKYFTYDQSLRLIIKQKPEIKIN